jgi:hypothetical protein
MWDWAVENWKWLTTPAVLAALYYLTADRSGRREREVEAWRAARVPAKGGAKGKPGAMAKKVAALPGDMAALVENVGGGASAGSFELAPKLAYLAVRNADAVSGSDHQTVVAKLDGPPISFTARPLPVVDGARAANTGIEFKKDPEFAEQFLVEGADPAAVKKWLLKPLREALLDLPDAWLTVRGRLMALTVFGPADAAQLEQLVIAADALFAEHGADGGPSLVGDEPDDGEGDAEDAAPDSGAKARADAKDRSKTAPAGAVVVKAVAAKPAAAKKKA